jgi:hypothetical protein
VSLKREELARRRDRLVAQAQAQRGELAYYHQRFEGPVHATEVALGFANNLRQSPLFITALAAVLIRTPWRRVARVPKWVWRGWRVAQFVRSLTSQPRGQPQ